PRPSSLLPAQEPARRARDTGAGQEPLLPAAAFSATLLKVLLALVPSVVMAVMHTTMIRASITAYSTAVGPSSSFRKRAARKNHVVMELPFLCSGVKKSVAAHDRARGRPLRSCGKGETRSPGRRWETRPWARGVPRPEGGVRTSSSLRQPGGPV